jgi:hypothetical protein
VAARPADPVAKAVVVNVNVNPTGVFLEELGP